MNIVVKFPTKSRPQRFLQTLFMYVDSSRTNNVHYLVSYDQDDATMTDEVIAKAKQIAGENITLVRGVSKNKIHACNRDLNEFTGEWDIVVLASDDMIPVVEDWDGIIQREMQKAFPDTDGCLWFYDGHQHDICTMCIVGRKYYNRFLYLYHEAYESLWCDNEFTAVARMNRKIRYNPICLFRHEHPMWTGRSELMDDLYRKNEAYFQSDKKIFKMRERRKFPQPRAAA